MSHTRSIDMTMSGATINYKIPLYGERPFIGEFKNITVKDGYIHVSFEASVEAKEYIKPPVVFQQISTEMEFK